MITLRRVKIDDLIEDRVVYYVPMHTEPIYPNDQIEKGRVKRISDDGSAVFVYYHHGDTAARTNIEDLYIEEQP